MMKALALLPLALLLAACQSDPTVVKTRLEVVLPDPSLYNCPSTKYPSYSTLTDEQVARLLIQQHKNNVTCRNSLSSIRTFLEESKKTIESNQVED